MKTTVYKIESYTCNIVYKKREGKRGTGQGGNRVGLNDTKNNKHNKKRGEGKQRGKNKEGERGKTTKKDRKQDDKIEATIPIHVCRCCHVAGSRRVDIRKATEHRRKGRYDERLSLGAEFSVAQPKASSGLSEQDWLCDVLLSHVHQSLAPSSSQSCSDKVVAGLEAGPIDHTSGPQYLCCWISTVVDRSG